VWVCTYIAWIVGLHSLHAPPPCPRFAPPNSLHTYTISIHICVCKYICTIYIYIGWLWLVGSIKLYVSFEKESYKRLDILRKRPIFLSILLTVATPYYMEIRVIARLWEHIVTNQKMNRIPYLCRSFFAKELYSSWPTCRKCPTN